MVNYFLIEEFGDRKIAMKGVGRLFYQDGVPLGISADKLKESNIEVSWLHVADEFLKEGWGVDKILSKFKDEIVDAGGEGIDYLKIEKFIYATYEDQREMIFNYLFGSREEAITWAKNKKMIT